MKAAHAQASSSNGSKDGLSSKRTKESQPSFKDKMKMMMIKKVEDEKKKRMLDQIKKKRARGVDFDANFFQSLE